MSQISAFNPTDQALRERVPSQFSKMSSEDFIKIIFTELSHQDPFAPTDSAALLEQLDSIRSIESDLKLTDQLKSLVTQNQLAAASNMIGKFIGGLTADNNRVAGFVVSVIKLGDTINLELDNGWIVPVTGVETVIDSNQLPDSQRQAASQNTPPQPAD